MENRLARIEAVLFDADGVIQRPGRRWDRAWADVSGRGGDLDRLLADIFAAEEIALDGRSSFVEALANILSTWNCHGTLQDALRAWTLLDVDTGLIDAIKSLRRHGIRCYLATNQEPHRAHYMSDTIGLQRRV